MSNYKDKIEKVYTIIEFYDNVIPTKIISFLYELKIDQSYIFLSFFFNWNYFKINFTLYKKSKQKKRYICL